MDLRKYIQGDNRGKEAHRLERKALDDPFLQDALDGLHSVKGDHTGAIERLERGVAFRAGARERRRRAIVRWSVAATLLLLLGLSGYLYFNRPVKAPVIATTQKTPSQQEVKASSTVAKEYSDAGEPVNPMVKFTPPVVKADEEIAEVDRDKKQAELTESSAAVGAVSFDKGTDDIVVPLNTDQYGKMAVVSEESKDTTSRIFISDSINGQLADVAKKEGYSAPAPLRQAKVLAFSIESSSKGKLADASAAKLVEFGKREFFLYCREKQRSVECPGRTISVKVLIDINSAGRPENFRFIQFGCEAERREMIRLLNSSPAWTNPGKDLTLEYNFSK